MDLYILKIGGSVATKKDENKFEANMELLSRIAKEIKKAMDEKKFRLVVVNGAGPFGHTNATQYQITEGLDSEKDFEGFSKTIRDCSRINLWVSDALAGAGINAIPFPSSSVVSQKGKNVDTFELDMLKKFLELGTVPVMNGTMVPDSKLNGSIVSGDAVIPYLAHKLGAKAVLMGVDVDGIYTADPKKDPKAEKVETISRDNYKEVLQKVGGASTVDVTGGMRGKIEKLKEMLSGTRIVIFSAKEDGNTYKALTGQKVGTEINL